MLSQNKNKRNRSVGIWKSGRPVSLCKKNFTVLKMTKVFANLSSMHYNLLDLKLKALSMLKNFFL